MIHYCCLTLKPLHTPTISIYIKDIYGSTYVKPLTKLQYLNSNAVLILINYKTVDKT